MKTLSLLLWCSLASLSAQEKVDVRLNWQAGKSYQQQIRMEQVIGIPRHGEASAHTDLEMKLEAREGKKSSRNLLLTFSRMKMEVDLPLPLGNEEFDSSRPSEGSEEIGDFYKSLQQSPVKLVLDPRGKVLEVVGMDKLSGGNSMLSRFMGKEQMKNFLQQGGLVELPKAPVAFGDNWPFQSVFPTPVGKLLIKGKYTLTGTREHLGKPHYVITMHGQVQGDFSAAAVSAGGKETDPDVLELQGMMILMGVTVKEGTTSGTLLYDPLKHLLVSSDVSTNIRLSVAKFPENGKPAEIPIQQKLSLQLLPSP